MSRYLPTPVPLALAGVLLILGCRGPRPHSQSKSVDSLARAIIPTAACPPDTLPPVAVSLQCIGPIALNATLGEVRARFPDAQESSFRVEEASYAALDVRLGGLVVTATQFGDSLEPGRPCRPLAARPSALDTRNVSLVTDH